MGKSESGFAKPPRSGSNEHRFPRAWDESDEFGDLTYRLTSIELSKSGVRVSNKSLPHMSKTELLEERSAMRRAANDLSQKATAASQKGDMAASENFLKMAEEVARRAMMISDQIDTNESAAEYFREGKTEKQYRNSQGGVVPVLGRNDMLSDLLAFSGAREEFGIGEYIAAMVSGTNNPAIRNALSEGTDSAGGYTVPKHLMAQLFDRMRAKTVVVKAGAVTIPLDTQQTTIARLASDPVAGWRAENALVTESDPTFEGVQFVARSLAVLVKVSRELLDDSLNINQALANAFAGSMAVEVDRVSLFGSGTAPEPRGIANTPNVNSVSMGTNGAQLTSYGKFLDALYENEVDNAAPPTAAIMHPRTWRTVQGFVDSTGQPLQLPPALTELPQMVTTTVPVNQVQGSASNASSIIFGDFSQLVLGLRQELRIEVLRERFAENMQYGFLAHLRMDVAVAHPESFCKLIGIIP